MFGWRLLPSNLVCRDFAKNFVRAEVRSFDEALSGANPQIQGPKYIVQDGDVLFFRGG